MRIVAGKYRGRKLTAFAGFDVRPTPDRVKESLFQILSPRLRGAVVLDLFCGSGALGIESLSRGAGKAYFNDLSAESLSVLKKNLVFVGEPYEVSRCDFRAFLLSAREKFDLVFCDPPYREDYLPEILSLLAKRDLLKEDGLVVYETEREEEPAAGWELCDRRRYGRTDILFLKRSEP